MNEYLKMPGARLTRIVTACDSFKGSLSSHDVNSTVSIGVKDALPDCEVVGLDLGDGGEGTARALAGCLGADRRHSLTIDPFGRPVEAEWFVDATGSQAIMEVASACGIGLLARTELDPWTASTEGVGVMIADICATGGVDRLLVALGGSATVDGGMGMLYALGCRFYDSDGVELPPCGGSLGLVAAVDTAGMDPAVINLSVTLASDVDSPLCGRDGAARMFGPQKGADPIMVERLEAGMMNFGRVLSKAFGRDCIATPGAGAAGGLGFAFMTAFRTESRRGIELMLEVADFDRMLDGAGLVITGEGHLDRQTAMSKAPAGVARAARRRDIPVVAIGGGVSYSSELLRAGFDAICCVTPKGMPLEEAMRPETARRNIRRAVGDMIAGIEDQRLSTLPS